MTPAYHLYFDPETGESLKGVTRQDCDDSAWARPGMGNHDAGYRYVKDDSAFNLFKGMTNYFLNRLRRMRYVAGSDIADGSNRPGFIESHWGVRYS